MSLRTHHESLAQPLVIFFTTSSSFLQFYLFNSTLDDTALDNMTLYNTTTQYNDNIL